MCEDICIYIFGYGSLIWRPGFPYLRRFDGYIKGWRRGFWQGSIDHRGTPEYPGRVVTLIKDPYAVTWGTVYCIPDEEAASILKNLDYREKNGYAREEVDVFIHGRETPVVTKSILYVANNENCSFLGESPVEDIASTIYKSVGPSGPNADYLLNLAESMRRMNAEDPHVFELEAHVLRLVKASPLSHHNHPSLQSLRSTINIDNFQSTTQINTALLPSTTNFEHTNNEPTLIGDSKKPINSADGVFAEQSDMQRRYFMSPKATVKGSICVDAGAMMAVSQRGRSLLAAGIVTVTGQFEPQELVSVTDYLGTEIARGITTYGSEEIMKLKGSHSAKISEILGFTRGETVVHYHNMILV